MPGGEGAPVEVGAEVPRATRAATTAWRDPRMILGVVIVAGCVLLGARLAATADDRVEVWSVGVAVPAGAPVEEGNLRPAEVHLPGDELAAYLSTSEAVPAGSRARHDLAAGELLARSALGAPGEQALVEVPLSVAPDDVPRSVRRGSVVDVWVTARTGSGERRGDSRARQVLDDVVVLAVPAASDGLAPAATRQVIVGVPPGADLGDALGSMLDGRVVLTRRPDR